MNLSAPFIRRPVATSLLMLTLLLVGLLGWRLLPVAALPQVDYPIIRVLTLYPGASAEVMASAVTAPLERQLGQMPGLEQMAATSSSGVSLLVLRFGLQMDLGVAEQQVQAAINAADNLLPADLPAPPLYSKVNPADTPVLTLAVRSPVLPLPEVYDLVDTRLAQKLAQVSGVGLVTLAGGQRPAVRVRANPQALAAHGLTLADVRTTIRAATVNQPKGSLDGELRVAQVDANDQLRTLEDFRNLLLAYEDGAALRLGEVASVSQAAENRRLAAWADREQAVLIHIQRQPGANVIQVAERVQALLPQLREVLPASVQIEVLADRTTTIRAAVRDVQFELLLAIALVVAVTFVFLRRLAATLIPSLAVPLSLVATFAAMYLAGFSLNNLSLMALTIATGFVVDDAIVMLENVTRHIEDGETPLQAALKGARQIGFTLLSLTFSLIAVLIPLLFMADVVGRLFREFAITLAVAILISLVVSLTLTPMLCARWLKAGKAAAEPRLDWMQRLTSGYGHALDWVLRHQTLTLLVAVASFVLTVALYLAVPKGFFPVQDTGLLQGVSRAPQAISFAAMAERQQRLTAVLLADPAVAGVGSWIGADGDNASLNQGRLLISLKPHGERDGAQAVIERLRPQLAQVSGIELFLQPVQDLSVEDRVGRTPYRLTLESADGTLLDQWGPQIAQRLAALPELRDVASEQQGHGLQAWLQIDRQQAARLGISASDIDSALYDAFGQRQIATLFTQSNQYRVVLEAEGAGEQGLAALQGIHLKGAGGAVVPLRSLVSIQERSAPLAIERLGQLPALTLGFDLAPEVALGAAVAAIQQVLADAGMPASVSWQLQGAAAAFSASLDSTLWLILAAVVTMYIVLGMLYESWIHPLTILSTLPSAAVGALLALLLSGQDLGLIAVIGIILLIGIVKKNAIMMIDFALEAERQQGMAPQDAIRQAALLRLRPILMTTCAALFGALPLMLATGSGAELRQPLGLVMVGGLLVSQLLTLFTTPVIYLWFDRVGRMGRVEVAS